MEEGGGMRDDRGGRRKEGRMKTMEDGRRR